MASGSIPREGGQVSSDLNCVIRRNLLFIEDPEYFLASMAIARRSVEDKSIFLGIRRTDEKAYGRRLVDTAIAATFSEEEQAAIKKLPPLLQGMKELDLEDQFLREEANRRVPRVPLQEPQLQKTLFEGTGVQLVRLSETMNRYWDSINNPPRLKTISTAMTREEIVLQPMWKFLRSVEKADELKQPVSSLKRATANALRPVFEALTHLHDGLRHQHEKTQAKGGH